MKKLCLLLMLLSTLSLYACIINGFVKDENGRGISNVTMKLTGPKSQTVTTDETGKYQFDDNHNWLPAGIYTVTPSKAGQTFTPPSQTVTITTQDFEGSPTPWPVNNVNFTEKKSNTSISDQGPDTGQTRCFDNENVIPCPNQEEAFHGQDAQYSGPDRSYTKLGKNGIELQESSTQEDGWIMTRDNVTGLIWEIKTDDGSVHDKHNTYTWYDSNPSTNGGYAGTPGDGTDTEDFIDTLNDEAFGGFSDWRLPTVKELVTLIKYNNNRSAPAIDTIWFPNTYPYPYYYTYC